MFSSHSQIVATQTSAAKEIVAAASNQANTVTDKLYLSYAHHELALAETADDKTDLPGPTEGNFTDTVRRGGHAPSY